VSEYIEQHYTIHFHMVVWELCLPLVITCLADAETDWFRVGIFLVVHYGTRQQVVCCGVFCNRPWSCFQFFHELVPC
jgi:hypothetical protein